MIAIVRDRASQHHIGAFLSNDTYNSFLGSCPELGGWQVDQIQHLKIRKSSDIVPSTSMIEPSQYLDDGKKE